MTNIVEFPASYFTRTVVDGVEYLPNEASAMENRHLQHIESGGYGFAVKFESDIVIRYSLLRPMTDSEGNLSGWRYFPLMADTLDHPQYANTVVIVMDDFLRA